MKTTRTPNASSAACPCLIAISINFQPFPDCVQVWWYSVVSGVVMWWCGGVVVVSGGKWSGVVVFGAVV
ncbi:hypothetical protein E2C01_100182 [Portunus trituberculatus]|uniref:Uncharacterized protein n=1 Tax=Portunus trituberculatus TaxID=210409 RepID=A0A5B7KHA5_PORTR|nr:hypothetical protein [Portunus trituberculatus]